MKADQRCQNTRARFLKRSLRLEPLEDRRLLAASDELPWHNALYRLDVTGDAVITTGDALAIVNRILSQGPGELPVPTEPPTSYYDTTGDNRLTSSDLLAVINGILTPPEVSLSTLTPFTADLTPQVTVTATQVGNATLPDGTLVEIDVDLNNDGDFSDPGERGQSQSTLFQGQAKFDLSTGLADTPDVYGIKLRARVKNSDAVSGSSDELDLLVDVRTSTALEDYVNAPDDSYTYSVHSTNTSNPAFTYYVLRMTSQTWRSTADVDDPVWDHWMGVYVPNAPIGHTALMAIGGGSNTSGPPSSSADELGAFAALSGTVVFELTTVPNERVTFTDETFSRTEDEIIAYTFDKYMEHLGEPGNETWPLLLPMVKSAVRAMDTIQDFIPSVRPGASIDDFVVFGGSKRGWTTWLTAAVDDRVGAIMPGVIDVLNIAPQMVHHYGAYGFFSAAIEDYENLNIFDRIMTDEGRDLFRIVDPYRYLNNGRFADMPKLIMNSAGDEFFVSDSAQYYIHDLPGDKNRLRYVPNTGHGLEDTAVYNSIVSFYGAYLLDAPLPQYSWTVEQDGSIHVQTTAFQPPSQVRLWQATNPISRDFRNQLTGNIWTSSILADQGGGTYIGDVPMPATGATAYFVELTYPFPSAGVPPYVFTTEIRVKTELPLHPWPFETSTPLSSDQLVAATLLDEPPTALAEPAPQADPLASEEFPWHNDEYRFDVNGDQTVTTSDVLAIVNRILNSGTGDLPVPPLEPVTLYYDTTGDNRLTTSDLLAVVNGVLSAPQVELSMLTPYSVDLTPEVSLTAMAVGSSTIPDGTLVEIDVDFNNDGDFSDPGERGQSQSTIYQGQARFNLAPGLADTPELYTVKLRARLQNSDAVGGTSNSLALEIDNRVSSALEDYINAPSTFSWEQAGPPINGAHETPYRYYVLQMTSQVWRSEEDVNLPQWNHWMEVYVPYNLAGEVADLNPTSLLFIRGGSNTSNQPTQPDDVLSKIATDTQSVVTVLRVVPNQDVVFTDETQPREEDEIIAYTLDKYLEHLGEEGNETWPVLLPMVKSAVRAMDTVQGFIGLLDPSQQVDDFIVSGESKRGWTTWLTAAADDRVRGIMPGVFDNLNQAAQMVNHYSVLGKFSEQVHDYTDLQIFERILTPEAQLLGQIVDPYSYLRNGRFDDMPKLILNSAGDEFFVPDSSRFYFHDLPGEQNYLRYIPNTGHGLDNRAVSSRKTFYDAILNDRTLPKYSWNVEQDGSIHVETDTQPTQVLLWQKINSNARDFRSGYTPQIFWFSTPLTVQPDGTYVGNVATPATGAVAYLIELTWPNSVPGADPYVFTTEARIKSNIPLAAWPYDTGLVVDSAAPLVENQSASVAPLVVVADEARDSIIAGLAITNGARTPSGDAASLLVRPTGSDVVAEVAVSSVDALLVPARDIADDLAELTPQDDVAANAVDELFDTLLDELLV